MITAAMNGDMGECLSILRADENQLLTTDSRKRTPLHIAAHRSNFGLMDELVTI